MECLHTNFILSTMIFATSVYHSKVKAPRGCTPARLSRAHDGAAHELRPCVVHAKAQRVADLAADVPFRAACTRVLYVNLPQSTPGTKFPTR